MDQNPNCEALTIGKNKQNFLQQKWFLGNTALPYFFPQRLFLSNSILANQAPAPELEFIINKEIMAMGIIIPELGIPEILGENNGEIKIVNIFVTDGLRDYKFTPKFIAELQIYLDIFSSFELNLESFVENKDCVEIIDLNTTIKTITTALIKKIENYLKESDQYKFPLKRPSERPYLRLVYQSNKVTSQEIHKLYNELNNKNINFKLILK